MKQITDKQVAFLKRRYFWAEGLDRDSSEMAKAVILFKKWRSMSTRYWPLGKSYIIKPKFAHTVYCVTKDYMDKNHEAIWAAYIRSRPSSH